MPWVSPDQKDFHVQLILSYVWEGGNQRMFPQTLLLVQGVLYLGLFWSNHQVHLLSCWCSGLW